MVEVFPPFKVVWSSAASRTGNQHSDTIKLAKLKACLIYE
jgi:hypothetical protein